MEEFNERADEQERRIDMLEEKFRKIKDLHLLAETAEVSGERLMNKITEYVMTEGMNAKIKELRGEFFSKGEWKG